MYKNIKKLILSLMVFCGFNGIVNAESIYDHLSSGDIIIGNTTFNSGTWISATRASKAGSLYTLNSGNSDVKTYIFINQNVWYELDQTTETYRTLNKTEIRNIESNLNVYYNNNEPLDVTFSYENTTFEETLLEEFGLFPNENLKIDTINKTVTCKYGTIIENKFTPYDQVEYGYSVKCVNSLDVNYFDSTSPHTKSLEIKEITVPTAARLSTLTEEEEEAFIAQNYITADYKTWNIGEIKNNFLTITTDTELTYAQNFVVVELKFIDENDISYISALPYTDDVFLNLETLKIYEDNSIIVGLDAFENDMYTLILIDELYNKIIKLHINIEKLYTPTLSMTAGGGDTTTLTITHTGAYGQGANNDLFDGFELYETNGDNLILIDSSETTFWKDVTLDIGERKTIVARVYKYDDSNNKIYSKFSNEITLEYILYAPTLSTVYGGPTSATLSIRGDGIYAYDEEWEIVDGFELYKKIGSQYILVFDSTTEFEKEVNTGENATYVAKVYKYNKAHQKIYSNYSNELYIE